MLFTVGGFRSEFDLFRDIFGDASPFGGHGGGHGGHGMHTDFGGGGGGFAQQQPRKGRDTEIEYGLSLEDMFNGCTKKIKLTRNVSLPVLKL